MATKKILHAVLSPWPVSLVISLVIYLLVPVNIGKHSIELKGKEEKGNVHRIWFDLDHDGSSEKIDLYEDFIGRVGIIVYSEGRLLDQWNFDKQFKGNLSTRSGLFFDDIDHDGIDEIILSTFNKGDILLHCFNPLKDEIIFTDRKIGSYTLSNDRLNTGVLFAGGYDANHDGLKEIYFTLRTSYSLQPRGMRVYDPVSDTLIRSPKNYNMLFQPLLADIDQDGIVDLFASSFAPGNSNKEDPYSDHYTWLMVFNPEMKFKFEPVKTGIYPSAFIIQPYELNKKRYFAGLYIYQGKEKSPCYIALYNSQGALFKKREIPYSADLSGASFLTHSDKLSVIYQAGRVVNYNADLEVESTFNIGQPVLPNRENKIVDANNDGKPELLFLSKNRDKLIIAALDFSSIAEIALDENIRLNNYSVKLTGRNPPELFVEGDRYNYTFLYAANPFFPFRFLVFPAIYLIILGIVGLLSKMQRIRLEQRYTAEKQLLEFQLKSVKNQLDPHFTLNLLTSIGDLFDKKDSKTSRYVFSKYSTLLRQSVLNADQYSVSLEQELEFVENYLKLEKFRLDDRFDFEITTNGMDGSIGVPKMLIHSFVENAVKHGIQYLKKGGTININVRTLDKTCFICIKDNGIGRERSHQMTKLSTGKGLSMIDRIVKSYNELKKAGISYRINDLKDNEGNALGTEAVVKIPLKTNA